MLVLPSLALLLVDGADDGYLKAVCDYVRLNPAWATYGSLTVSLEQLAGTSNDAPTKRPAWLRVDGLPGNDTTSKGRSGRPTQFRAQADG